MFFFFLSSALFSHNMYLGPKGKVNDMREVLERERRLESGECWQEEL